MRRSREQKMVGGVIGGFAEYFDRDPGLMRLLYIVISIVSAAFPGIFVYLILWALIPLAETTQTSPARASGEPVVVP
ncbi:MAG: PspC domain-containing protein [Thermoanaerobaculia bacterium]